MKDPRGSSPASGTPDRRLGLVSQMAIPSASQGTRSGTQGRRLIVVSNRLPFTISEVEGEVRFTEATGGLVTGMRSYLAGAAEPEMDSLWVGWPGSTLAPEIQEAARKRSFDEAGALPVFLTEKDMEQFYHGFCNKTIWPLFHYFAVYTVYLEDHTGRQYAAVNPRFCAGGREDARPVISSGFMIIN